MTTYDIDDDRLSETIAERAVDFLNSGAINFDIVSADGNSAAAISLVRVHRGDETASSRGRVLGYTYLEQELINGAGSVWTFPERMPGLTQAARLDAQITNIVHESNHLDYDIDRQRREITSTLESLGVDLSGDSGERVNVIVEEKLVRDATNLIGRLSPDFNTRRHYDNIDRIISAYREVVRFVCTVSSRFLSGFPARLRRDRD